MYELKGENFLKWDSSKQKWHDFWGELWTNNDTKWDQNGPHPAIVESYSELSKLSLIKKDSFHYEPGCGRAYIGALLSGLGYEVLCEDLNSLAVEKAKELHSDAENLTIREADIFQKDEKEVFDCYWDRAMMSALHPELWPEYVEKVSELIKDGGFYIAVLFESFNEDVKGPPYAMSFEKMWELFEENFSLFSAKTIKCEAEPVFVENELVVILRRKERV